MLIDPGKMDRLITVQRRVENRTGTGEAQYTWVTYTQLWAQLMDVGGRERYLPSGRQAEVSTVFRTYFDEGITETMRILYDGVYYDIRYLNRIGYQEGLEIRCKGIKD